MNTLLAGVFRMVRPLAGGKTTVLMVAGLALAGIAAVRQEVRSGNPILPGWYADPEAHVFDGRYWIYPTYSARYNEQVFTRTTSRTTRNVAASALRAHVRRKVPSSTTSASR